MARTKIDTTLTPALCNYRRPSLGWASVSVIGLDVYKTDGVNNYAWVLFPDGQLREETNTARRTFVITRNAVLTASGAQSGLRTSLSEATNTWYALYAVKISDSMAGFVVVGDTTMPIYNNKATLDSAYGVNGWVYLGPIRNGNNGSATGDILQFSMSNNTIVFMNAENSNSTFTTCGILLADTASATGLTYTLSRGTGAAQIPDQFRVINYHAQATSGSGAHNLRNTGNTTMLASMIGTGNFATNVLVGNDGVSLSNGSSVAMSLFCAGVVDNALGDGANPVS